MSSSVEKLREQLGVAEPKETPEEWSERNKREAREEAQRYHPTGNSPVGYLERGICGQDILLGSGFLERGAACLLAGPSGIGKSSIAMQMGCCWSCGKGSFDIDPPRELRIVMVQNEDSANDLVRQSESLRFLGLNQDLIHKNFWIETVRGKIGKDAISVMYDLVKWHQADLLLLNPLSAYHDGDISLNRDNVKFLYGELGGLLAELRVGLFGFHHKGKPPKNQGKNHQEDVYYQVMYDILGGSVLTNFFRGIITVSPIASSQVFKFIVAKRFEESGWLMRSQQFKWHEDRAKRLWVPASAAETSEATKTNGKTIADLYRLLPILDNIHRDQFELVAKKNGFTRPEYRGLLAEASRDDTPDHLRIHHWEIYTGKGAAAIHYARSPQPDNQKPDAIKAAFKLKKTEQKSLKTP